jgi:hypothetical protein
MSAGWLNLLIAVLCTRAALADDDAAVVVDRLKNTRSRITHHTLAQTAKQKASVRDPGWIPTTDLCAENLEIPKVCTWILLFASTSCNRILILI